MPDIHDGLPPVGDSETTSGDRKPVGSWDTSDSNPAFVANLVRGVQRDMNAGFELMSNKLLVFVERLTEKFDDLLDKFDEERARRSEYEARTDHRISSVEQRLTALEQPTAPPPTSRKTVSRRRKTAKKRK